MAGRPGASCGNSHEQVLLSGGGDGFHLRGSGDRAVGGGGGGRHHRFRAVQERERGRQAGGWGGCGDCPVCPLPAGGHWRPEKSQGDCSVRHRRGQRGSLFCPIQKNSGLQRARLLLERGGGSHPGADPGADPRGGGQCRGVPAGTLEAGGGIGRHALPGGHAGGRGGIRPDRPGRGGSAELLRLHRQGVRPSRPRNGDPQGRFFLLLPAGPSQKFRSFDPSLSEFGIHPWDDRSEGLFGHEGGSLAGQHFAGGPGGDGGSD